MSEDQVVSVKEIVARGKKAQEKFAFATQEQADAAAHAVLKVVYDNQVELGTMAFEETRMGDLNDKIAKCKNKSSQIWHSIKNEKSVGIINRDEEKKIIEIAKPMGVVASIVPSTNPVVTPMSNAAFSLKTRNAVVFAPHPRAVKLTAHLVTLFRAELAKLGLPEDLVQAVSEVSLETTTSLMAEADVIVATGGMGMVKSAYSSGKPAYGVGAGNVQVIVDTDADLADAAKKILQGRRFDNGLICLGEQTIFVQEEQMAQFIDEFNKVGGYYVTDATEVEKLREGVFPGQGPISRDIVGQNAMKVAELSGIEVPEGTLVIAATASGLGHADVLCREKMCPVLNIMSYKTFEEGVAMMVENLAAEGIGHSVGVHSNNDEHIEYVGTQCCVSRCIVNQPTGTTGGGSPTNGFVPTTTLGCGSWGNNSFSGNLNYTHLMNITRIGYLKSESYLPDPALAWEE